MRWGSQSDVNRVPARFRTSEVADPDSHFDRARDAVAEAERRVADPVSADAMTRITEGRYGGFQVFTVSRTLAIDVLLGQVENGILDPGMVPRAFRT